MAKQKEEGRSPAGLAELQTLARDQAQAPAAPPGPPPDPKDDEIRRLRERIAELQRQAREKQPEAHPAAREPAVYRVGLQGARCRLTTVSVAPHERRAKDEHLGVEPASYDALELFLSLPRDGQGRPSGHVQQAAWERFMAANGLGPADRRGFRVRVEAGATVDTLDVPAEGRAEAVELFKLYNGVLSTDKPFSVEKVERDEVREQEAAAA